MAWASCTSANIYKKLYIYIHLSNNLFTMVFQLISFSMQMWQLNSISHVGVAIDVFLCVSVANEFYLYMQACRLKDSWRCLNLSVSPCRCISQSRRSVFQRSCVWANQCLCVLSELRSECVRVPDWLVHAAQAGHHGLVSRLDEQCRGNHHSAVADWATPPDLDRGWASHQPAPPWTFSSPPQDAKAWHTETNHGLLQSTARHVQVTSSSSWGLSIHHDIAWGINGSCGHMFSISRELARIFPTTLVRGHSFAPFFVRVLRGHIQERLIS